jgi:fatty-acid desaturase
MRLHHRDGGLWAHLGWMLTGRTMHNKSADLLPYVPDLRKDKLHVWISQWHWVPITAQGVIILVAGGWQYPLWGIFLRTVIGLHSTWLGELCHPYVGIATVSDRGYVQKHVSGWLC